MIHIKKLLALLIMTTSMSYADTDIMQASEPNFLPPDQAFKISILKKDTNIIEVNWKIEKGYYLYLGMFEFSTDNRDVSIISADMPEGKKKKDEFFGDVDVYYTKAKAVIELDSIIENTNLIVKYQGCADAGLCYPPQIKKIPLDKFVINDFVFKKVSISNNQFSISEQLVEKSFVFNIFLFFIAGLLLAFTPCVFPMIPILTGLIVGQGNNLTTKKSFMLSLTYVLSMSFTYAIAGVLIAVSGSNIQADLQNPYVISIFSGLFVLLALSMFNIITIQMPKYIQNLLISKSNESNSGTYIGVGMMGSLSALIVGPCVTAPLIGALIYISTTNDYLIGGTALFALGLGMGFPLLLLGTSASEIIKKIGPYLEITNKIFGVLFLVVSIWLLERIVSLELAAILWIFLALTIAFLLFSINLNRLLFINMRRVSVIVLSLYAILQIYGINVNKSYDPITSFYEKKQLVNFIEVTDSMDLFKAIKSSKEITMVDVYADWCIACKELEKYTFTDKEVSDQLNRINLVKFDITKTNEDNSKFLNDYKLFGPPILLFFDQAGNEIESSRIIGFIDADTFIKKFNSIKTGISTSF